MKYAFLMAFALIGSASALASGNDNIVVNGSFESLPGQLNRGTWGQFSTLSGWIQGNNDKFEIQLAKDFQTSITGRYNAFNTSSSDHSAHYLEINANKLGVVSQTLNTVAGQSYNLSFDYSGRSDSGLGNNSRANVYWDDVLVASLNEAPNSGWKSFNYTLSAVDNSTVLRFVSVGPTLRTTYGSYLDAVSVTAVAAPVPEPETYAMFLAGLGLMGTVARRRQKQ